MSPSRKRARIFRRKGGESPQSKGKAVKDRRRGGAPGLHGAGGAGRLGRRHKGGVAPILDGLGDVPPKPGPAEARLSGLGLVEPMLAWLQIARLRLVPCDAEERLEPGAGSESFGLSPMTSNDFVWGDCRVFELRAFQIWNTLGGRDKVRGTSTINRGVILFRSMGYPCKMSRTKLKPSG